jgi:hypothetical protein
LPEKSRVVSGYLKELRQTKKEKPDQIREALEIYIQLWESVIQKGLIRPEDTIDEALKKIDANGGLYHAAED